MAKVGLVLLHATHSPPWVCTGRRGGTEKMQGRGRSMSYQAGRPQIRVGEEEEERCPFHTNPRCLLQWGMQEFSIDHKASYQK